MTTTYKDAGVDIDAGNEFIKRIIPHVKSTYDRSILSGVGGFAAHVSLDLAGLSEPVLVSSTDGVGTKLKIAQELGKYDTIGIDLVAMCVNDICCSGAKPLFFLDYFAVEKLKPEEHSQIIKGITDGCKIAGCALIGGETAELPGIYAKDDFDMAGFSVGIVDRKKIVDGKKIKRGDKIIGIASSGIHSNGYSLVRKVLSDNKVDLKGKLAGSDKTIGETVLEPTRIYSPLIEKLGKKFDLLGIAHITGGGLVENVPRILPENVTAVIDKNSWSRPAIFNFLMETGRIEEFEMQRVFNLGIGMVIIVDEAVAVSVCAAAAAAGEKAFIAGEICEAETGRPQTILE